MSGTTGSAPANHAASRAQSVAYCDPSHYGIQGGFAWTSYSMTVSGDGGMSAMAIVTTLTAIPYPTSLTTQTAVPVPTTTITTGTQTPVPVSSVTITPWPCPEETFPTRTPGTETAISVSSTVSATTPATPPPPG
jgi:hypothetical protein